MLCELKIISGIINWPLYEYRYRARRHAATQRKYFGDFLSNSFDDPWFGIK